MGKIHQVLAVEKDLKNKSSKIIDEAYKTFNQRAGLFNETRKTYTPFDEKDTDQPDESHEPMQTTVAAKLAYVENSLIPTLDILFQKERANAVASANIEVEQRDGTKKVLIEGVPVSALVQLENMLEEVRNKVYNEIPTLDPAKVWKKDESTKDVHVAEPVLKQRTRKVNKVITLAPATDKHPAQAQIVAVDEPVGTWTHSTKSGCLSPAQKSDLLDRIERLLAGIKIARAKANDTEVEPAKIGKTLFNFINGI